MLFIDKPINREIVCCELLIELFGTKFFLPLILEKTDNSQHQEKDAKEIQKYAFV